MARYRPAYPPEFRRQMVDLVRSGRTPEELSREFEPSAAPIAGWVCRADAEDGTRPDMMTAAEREELAFAARTASFARSATYWQRERRNRTKPGGLRPRRTPGLRAPRTGVRADADQPGHPSRPHHGPRAGCLDLRLLRLAGSSAVGPAKKRCRPAAPHPHDPRGFARDLRRTARSRRVAGRGRPSRAQARGAADVRDRDRRCQPKAQHRHHDHPHAGTGPCRGSGPPEFHRRRPQSALGGRHHLRPDSRGLSLPRGRTGRLVPSDCRLGVQP